MTEALRVAKDSLREQVAGRLKDLAFEELARRSLQICERVRQLSEFRNAETVLLYAALPDEVNVDVLIDQLIAEGKQACLPVCRPQVCDMDAVRVNDRGRDLVVRHFGIPAPRDGLELVEPQQVDLCIIPGRAFDHKGGRVGRGWGTYDHFLVRARADVARVAVSWDLQVFDEVPVGKYDQPMQVLVTESGAVRIGKE
jgi:5-formyltetrahydrofolate cyclo-ligase